MQYEGATRGMYIDQHLSDYIQSDTVVMATGGWLISSGGDAGERVALAGAGTAETDRRYH